MNIVCGCPRSGTSLMMQCCLAIYGESYIVGKQFPMIEKIEKGIGETEAHFQCRLYNHNEFTDNDQKVKDMNPDGFWECPYTCQGIHYHFGDEENLKKYNRIYSIENKEYFCKIVSQGLIQSDPQYIDKIIYMIRHPLNVAKSQERLTRNLPGTNHDMSKDFKINTPEMFIKVTYMAARWLLKNPKPLLLIEYDDLISEPLIQLKYVTDFIGYGDYSLAKDCIKPELKRSTETIENEMQDDAIKIYKLFKQGLYQEIVDYLNDPKLSCNYERTQWYCSRISNITNIKKCILCTTLPGFKKALKNNAISMKIDWQKEPCLYECGMNVLTDKYKTIEQSIKENTWNE